MKKTPTCFDATVLSKQVGDFFQILWSSHNVLTFSNREYTNLEPKAKVDKVVLQAHSSGKKQQVSTCLLSDTSF